MASAQGAATPGQSYDGTGRPAVAIPRLATPAVTIDGSLAEPVWSQAARLTGFHQYQPLDGRPADEQTEARVFYSHDAIYFGDRRATRRIPASIRATVADRDNLGNEDRVTIYLDTFNDHRRAYFFVVNPLGAQGDGVRTEGAASAGNIFGGNVDWNPDFRFESKGQLTDSGYVVELRIPFKSLRFPTGDPQTWGINVVRDVQSTGFEDTWTDARRATASFLSEGGSLTGIANIERGITTEVQPFVTAQWNGARERDRRVRSRGRESRRRREPQGRAAVGDARRDGEARLLAGRVGRRTRDGERAVRVVLRREAAVLPRGDRAVQHAEPARVHSADRDAGCGREGDRQARPGQRRVSLRAR